MPKITLMMWYDTQAEEAANLYVSVFKNSKITGISHFPDDSTHGTPGGVMTVDFELDGQQYTALNGGPFFQFNESVSLVVHCKDQEEVDYYWDALIKDGGQESDCGWLKDKFGMSWQITPQILLDYMVDPDPEKAKRVHNAMLTMKKLDVQALQDAYNAK